MLKKKLQRGLSVMLAAAIGGANVVAVPMPFLAAEPSQAAVETEKYKAAVDLSTGSLTFQNLIHTGNGWSNTE